MSQADEDCDIPEDADEMETIWAEDGGPDEGVLWDDSNDYDGFLPDLPLD